MPSFQTRHNVPFSPVQMYDIVADVEQYPKFLPLCEGLRVISRDQANETTTLVATMDVGYKAIRESFTTRVELQSGKQRIDVSYLDGPFRYLENRWLFHKREGGCEIDFFIDYAFKNPMLAMVMGVVFEKAFRKFSQSFEDRAKVVYGNL